MGKCGRHTLSWGIGIKYGEVWEAHTVMGNRHKVWRSVGGTHCHGE